MTDTDIFMAAQKLTALVKKHCPPQDPHKCLLEWKKMSLSLIVEGRSEDGMNALAIMDTAKKLLLFRGIVV